MVEVGKETPRWERGYRVHGYWLGAERIGWIGLPPKRFASEYSFGIDKRLRAAEKSKSLNEAKLAVEKLCIEEGVVK